MENEEIMIFDDGDDSPISPMGMCCGGLYMPYRSI